MKARWTLKRIAHRTGLLASPSLAFQGVPFGPKRRDMAGEVRSAVVTRQGLTSSAFDPGRTTAPALSTTGARAATDGYPQR